MNNTQTPIHLKDQLRILEKSLYYLNKEGTGVNMKALPIPKIPTVCILNELEELFKE